MSARPAARGRARSIGLLLAVAAIGPLTSGCSAGQVAATARQVSTVEGASAHRGGLALLNVRIANPPFGSYARGADAALYGAVVTDEHTRDTLVSIRTDAASSVTLVHVLGGGGDSSPGPSESAASRTSPSESAAPSPDGAASPAGQLDLKLAFDQLLTFTEGKDFLQLRGLSGALSPGMTVRITFSFADAGDITVDVPVATSDIPLPRPTPSPALGG